MIAFDDIRDILEDYGDRHGTEAQLDRSVNLFESLWDMVPEDLKKRWAAAHAFNKEDEA